MKTKAFIALGTFFSEITAAAEANNINELEAISNEIQEQLDNMINPKDDNVSDLQTIHDYQDIALCIAALNYTRSFQHD